VQHGGERLSDMAGESNTADLKVMFNSSSPGAVLELVKDLVATANSGGGTIRIGATETSQGGIPEEALGTLDGARVSDQVNKYIAPCRARVSHEVTANGDGTYVVDLSIEACGKYPYVFSKHGQYLSSPKPGTAFREGDIYVRHGAKSERATYEDIVAIIERAVESNRDEIFHRIDQLAHLPEGYQPVFQTPAGIVASPETLIDLVAARRERHSGALLDGFDLLWCFTQRDKYDLTDARRRILVRSALRRTPTLYFWLSEGIENSDVEQILLSSLQDEDRDRSDAKDSILEVAALVATDNCLQTIVSIMAGSRYLHFREAASEWQGRAQALATFSGRTTNARVDGVAAIDLSVEQIYAAADRIAFEMLSTDGPLVRFSRILGDLGRVVYALKRKLWPG
jgi:hypothetical protein